MPDFGKLEYSAKEMNFIYRGTVYAVSDYPYEPCLYLKKDGRLLSVIHNSFTVDNLIRVFSEGGSVHDVDRESTAYDEAAFSRVLAAVVDSGRPDVDFTFAAKKLAPYCHGH